MNNIIKLTLLLSLILSSVYGEITIGYAGASVNKPSKEILIEINKLTEIAKQNSIEIKFKQLPWKRALLLLEKGMIDGVINASYKKDRAEYSVYPTINNQLDYTKRLNDGFSYFIYRPKDSIQIWDGEKFIKDNLQIGVMEKFAVVEDLEKHKNIHINKFVMNNDIVRKLLNKQLDGYASSIRYMEQLIETYPKLKNKFVKDPIPIRKKDYYLIFSKISYKTKSKELEKIWNGLKKYNEK